MSFITYDFKCADEECGTIEPDMMVHRSDVDSIACFKCGAPMKRLMPGPITTFKHGDRSAIKSRKAVSSRDPTCTPKVGRHNTSAAGSES